MFSSPLPNSSAARSGDDDDCDYETAKWSCDVMRKKIATFLASK